jgi:hypothetical protein
VRIVDLTTYIELEKSAAIGQYREPSFHIVKCVKNSGGKFAGCESNILECKRISDSYCETITPFSDILNCRPSENVPQVAAID